MKPLCPFWDPLEGRVVQNQIRIAPILIGMRSPTEVLNVRISLSLSASPVLNTIKVVFVGARYIHLTVQNRSGDPDISKPRCSPHDFRLCEH